MMFIIHGVWAVGMHHWGPRELVVGAGYRIERDERNVKDPNAVKVMEGPNVKAYLKRNNALVVSRLLHLGLSSKWLLKPKETALVRDRRTGPQQLCNIGCKLQSNENLESAKTLLLESGLTFELKQ
ncbi:hypothetical protein FSP39_011121 [Pinctada imbricata]|uniref:Uncharacterized protein n=1 Tax=Pinctada imbricata TaxID=66713 RepID=A0AA89CAR8_PINIB|nr:hypothetical protein FSP39_011121 [Pinctada imbricata]